MKIEQILLTAAIGLTGFIAYKIIRSQKPTTATGSTEQQAAVELSQQNMNPYGASEPGIFGL